MEKQINLIAFLSKVVSRNTQNYRKDFELDAQKLRDALTKSRQDERIFYFMSRPNGTWCVLERDALLCGSDGYPDAQCIQGAQRFQQRELSADRERVDDAR